MYKKQMLKIAKAMEILNEVNTSHKKAQDMLKRARLEAINKRNATLLRGEK